MICLVERAHKRTTFDTDELYDFELRKYGRAAGNDSYYVDERIKVALTEFAL